MKTYQYKITSFLRFADSSPIEDHMNRMGEVGWELVSVQVIEEEWQFFWKRPR